MSYINLYENSPIEAAKMNTYELNSMALVAIMGLMGLMLIKLFIQNSKNRTQEEVSKTVSDLHSEIIELSGAVKALLEINRQSGNDLKVDLNRNLENFRTTLTDQLGNTGRDVRETLTTRLGEIRSDTATKLEEMRRTVDEKLHATLEQRLGESFRQVSDRLEAVHRGLGEMQTLATGVGDLKRVLTNVKSRGTWGEVQLGALIEQTLTMDQYQKNISTKPNSRDIVEFAIRLPGPSAETPVWLPVDAKFPMEDYQRLVEAQDRADLVDIEAAAKSLEVRIKSEAKTIRQKYIEPPHTTDFAILFLPTEGLYAEVMRRQGLLETLQHDYRVTVAGPSTFSAMLNSLHMGFRTLAIEKRSSEIWNTLGQIKTEFGRFGEVIDATRKKLDAASKSFEAVDVRTRKINKTLSSVEALPITSSVLLDASTDDFLGDDTEPNSN